MGGWCLERLQQETRTQQGTRHLPTESLMLSRKSWGLPRPQPLPLFQPLPLLLLLWGSQSH
ncbi:unnamed protein product, partial [Gulo gulo]